MAYRISENKKFVKKKFCGPMKRLVFGRKGKVKQMQLFKIIGIYFTQGRKLPFPYHLTFFNDLPNIVEAEMAGE